MCAIEKSSVIEEELKMCGYFCIITSENMKAKEALELYKSRDVSEKLFKADKTFLGNRSMRVYGSPREFAIYPEGYRLHREDGGPRRVLIAVGG